MQTNKKHDFADIRWRIENNMAVSADEWAALFQHDHEALLDFMVMNNPSNVNKTLKYGLGIASLPFVPDQKKLAAQIALMRKTGNWDKLQKVYDSFKYNPNAPDEFTSNPELRVALRRCFPNWF